LSVDLLKAAEAILRPLIEVYPSLGANYYLFNSSSVKLFGFPEIKGEFFLFSFEPAVLLGPF